MADRNLNTTSQNAQRVAGLLHDAGDAAQVRRNLARLGLYPTRDVAGDPGHDYYETNIRNNLLPQAIAHLDRSDLVALFRLAEVLAAYPREEGFFAWYQGYQRERLAWYVELGMLPAELLEG
jgi:hypothetical protein